MWLGKLGIIAYVFSLSLTFSGYYVDQVFGTDLFPITEDNMNILVAKHNVPDETISAELIFGDFITGLRVLFAVLTGEAIVNALHLLPNFNGNWDYIVGLIFGVSTFFLWLNILTGRDL